jgi:hypothetical protein
MPDDTIKLTAPARIGGVTHKAGAEVPVETVGRRRARRLVARGRATGEVDEEEATGVVERAGTNRAQLRSGRPVAPAPSELPEEGGAG